MNDRESETLSGLVLSAENRDESLSTIGLADTRFSGYRNNGLTAPSGVFNPPSGMAKHEKV